MYGRGYQQQVRFGPPHTPDVIKWLLIANVGVFVLQHVVAGFTTWFAAWPVRFWSGALWQPFTYMWVHALDPMHLVFNMLSLWLLGGELERQWGSRRFLIYYLLCGVGAAPFIVAADLIPGGMHPPTVGASGAIFGIIVAFGIVFAERVIYLMALFPIKARTFAWIMFAVASCPC